MVEGFGGLYRYAVQSIRASVSSRNSRVINSICIGKNTATEVVVEILNAMDLTTLFDPAVLRKSELVVEGFGGR